MVINGVGTGTSCLVWSTRPNNSSNKEVMKKLENNPNPNTLEEEFSRKYDNGGGITGWFYSEKRGDGDIGENELLKAAGYGAWFPWIPGGQTMEVMAEVHGGFHSEAAAAGLTILDPEYYPLQVVDLKRVSLVEASKPGGNCYRVIYEHEGRIVDNVVVERSRYERIHVGIGYADNYLDYCRGKWQIELTYGSVTENEKRVLAERLRGATRRIKILYNDNSIRIRLMKGQ